MRDARRLVGALAAVAATLLAVPSLAEGDHHLIKISEVSAGSGPTNGYVELRMIAGGQQFVSGHEITVYNAIGAVAHVYTMDHDVLSGEDQRTVLIGDDGIVGTPDFTDAALDLSDVASAGAVCFNDALPPDCVSWGAGFGGNAMLPPPGAGTPFAGSLPNGTSALQRDLSGDCSLTLEDADDTDDSAADFASLPGSPTANSAAAGPDCPQTTITKKPKNPTTDRTPSFKFKSEPAGPAFECKLDDAEFEACPSPLDLPRQDRGKHTFRVMAENDPTPAKHGWKIVKP